MWCRECQQDVRGITSPESGDVICIRCQGVLAGQRDLDATIPSEGLSAASQAPDEPIERRSVEDRPVESDEECDEGTSSIPGNGKQSGDAVHSAHAFAAGSDSAPLKRPETDHWGLEKELEKVDRVLNSFKLQFQQKTSMSDDVVLGGGPSEAGLTGDQTQHDRNYLGLFSYVVSWAVLSIGIGTFVCGGVLLAWAFYSRRLDLVAFGLPIAFGGQLALLTGLFFQLESLNRNRWFASSRDLDKADQDQRGVTTANLQLSESRHGSETASTMRTAAPNSSLRKRDFDEVQQRLHELNRPLEL